MSSIKTTAAPVTGGDTSLGAFFRDMNASERRTFWACFVGWTLDAMDFMIYPLVIGTLIALWQVDRGTAGLAVTITLLASAVGGWLVGYMSDRVGRVRALQFTILWFSFFTLLCAFAQNYEQLFVARALLGLGFGGEWAAGAVLMGETIRAEYRGRAVGTVQSGWAVGWGVAVLLQFVCYSLLPPEMAWRWMFGLGAIPAVLIFFLRRYVDEPVIAAKTRSADAAHRAKPSIWEIFAPNILKTTLLAALLGTGAQGGYYAVTSWLPTFLRSERHLTVVGSTGYLAMLIAGSFVGYVAGAWLADRIGRRKLFITFAILASVLVIAYTRLPLSNEVMLFLGFPLGFCASAYFSGVGAFLTELFPTRLRGSGQGFAYNFGRGLGALFPTLVGYLSATIPLSEAIAIFAVLAYGLLFIAAVLLPETRGKVLEADD
ncbi:MFS transporter [Ferrovibrio xuzhouensis]|uniref:MFS transporter n=1 Tax=Ferrovibrio xuzhouensis TaxID=1576914 RepID=A0ABV7VEU3_9PROT